MDAGMKFRAFHAPTYSIINGEVIKDLSDEGHLVKIEGIAAPVILAKGEWTTVMSSYE